MTTATQSSAQRRLRVHLGLVGTTTGAVWGAVGLSLVDGVAVRTALSAAPTARTALLMAALLAAIPVGSLLGAPVLDLLSHAVGRRPAALASGVLVAVGAATAAAPRLWTGVAGGLVAGLGIGGYTIVVPKLAHELSERGHRRLVPRVRALAPAGAGTALGIGVSGGALLPGWGAACAWMAPLASALTACALVASLPETPHWYAARGRLDAAHEALKRVHGALEAAVAIDWVVLEAGMQGEQHPLGVDDLRIRQVRRMVLAGLVLELVQALPLGLAAVCLAPWALSAVGGRSWVPLWPALVLAGLWALLAAAGSRRRSERLLYAWVLGGTGVSACAVVLLVLLERLHGVGALVLLIIVAGLLVGGQYVAVVPACTGVIDPMVPPWLLRSQRRAGAVIRPLVQLLAVLGPAALLLVSTRVAIAVVLTCQLASMLLALLALPRAMDILR